MAQRYEADRQRIADLLSTTSPKIVVPEWQRSYSWDTVQVEIFWNDLIAFSERYPKDTITGQEYFLGSIVLVTGGANVELLDGQQRLATATILLSALRDARGLFSKDSATRLQTKFIGDYDDASDSTEFSLTLNRYDWEFFRRDVQELTDDSDRPVPSLKSHKRVREALTFFQAQIEAGRASCPDNASAHQWVLRVGKVLTDHFSVVAVSSSDPDNAASVFETLNDRGIGLSTPDLLRNFLLRNASQGDETRERIVSAWQTILAVDEDGSVDKYLRHYWVSHHGDVKNRKLYREIKETLQAKKIDSLEFSADLASESSRYRDLITARDEDAKLQRRLEAVKMLGADALYPALLAGYAAAEKNGNGAPLVEFADALITMFVRSAVIGGREAGRIESISFSTAQTLRADRDFDAAIATLREFSPEPAEFVARFAHASVSRQRSARYLLREIEHAKRLTEEVQVEGPDRVHLEHIYPQQPLDGARWPNHAAVINRLGNLTLLSKRINTSIRNGPFFKKKEKYAESDILLTRELCSFSDWNADAVSDRQSQLAGWAFRVWSFPGEILPDSSAASSIPDPEPSVAELPEFPDGESSTS